MIYFDACYIAKFYLAEPDSPSVTAFANGSAMVVHTIPSKAEPIHRGSSQRESVGFSDPIHRVRRLGDQFQVEHVSPDGIVELVREDEA